MKQIIREPELDSLPGEVRQNPPRLISLAESLRLRDIRIVAYVVIIFFCAVPAAWSTRHTIFSDGISYIEIARAYLERDWQNAINPYWSPLYSWLIAAVLWILKPGPYWQAATLHLVNLLGFVSALLCLELFLHELLQLLGGERGTLYRNTFYIAAYTMFPLAGLAFIGYPAPDEVGAALMLLLMALILRARRTGGSAALFAGIGVVCALFFLDRAGFIASIPVCVGVVLFSLWQQRRPVLYPAFLMIVCILAVAGPFVAAISHKEGHFTVGESGRLTYAWEVAGAPRFMYWEGEPGNIGTPIHPAKQVSVSPAAYIFDGPVGGCFPPWFEPDYWYAGIKPRLKLGAEFRALAVNLSVTLRLLLVAPIMLPALLLIFHMGARAWFRRVLQLWPVLLPVGAGLLSYCLVYVEKRYIIANLLLVWLLLLGSIRIPGERWRGWGNLGVQAICVVSFCVFLGVRVFPLVRDALWDLSHGTEREKNFNYEAAERLTQLGIHPGDKVAFIGEGLNGTDWARLDHLKVIGEVPMVWRRPQKLFRNNLIEDPVQIRAFWQAPAATREHVLDAFRKAGAVIAVSDGAMYTKDFPAEWHRLLLPNQIGKPRLKEDEAYLIREKLRYLRLR